MIFASALCDISNPPLPVEKTAIWLNELPAKEIVGQQNIGILYLQFLGLKHNIASRLGLTISTVHDVITGRHTSTEVASNVLCRMFREFVFLGKGDAVLTFRIYLEYHNCELQKRVASLLGLTVPVIAGSLTGRSKSQRILDALFLQLQLQQSAARQDDPAKKQLIARPGMYRGLYTRVAAQLGVSVSFVARVAHGQRKSPRVEQALTAEALRIENSLKASEVQQ